MAAVAKDPIGDFFLSKCPFEERHIKLPSRCLRRQEIPFTIEEQVHMYLDVVAESFGKHRDSLVKIDGFGEREKVVWLMQNSFSLLKRSDGTDEGSLRAN